MADVIAGRGLPFIFASGYGAAGAPFRDRPTLQKPFLIEKLEKGHRRVLRGERKAWLVNLVLTRRGRQPYIKAANEAYALISVVAPSACRGIDKGH